MKRLLFLFFGILLVCNSYSQESDSIYIFGCEDNWDNCDKYKCTLLLKIDSITANNTILMSCKNEKKILHYTINEFGYVKNIYFKDNNGFGHKLDSIIFNTLNNLKFKDAAVFNPCSKKRYTINFTLPINVIDKQSLLNE